MLQKSFINIYRQARNRRVFFSTENPKGNHSEEGVNQNNNKASVEKDEHEKKEELEVQRIPKNNMQQYLEAFRKAIFKCLFKSDNNEDSNKKEQKSEHEQKIVKTGNWKFILSFVTLVIGFLLNYMAQKAQKNREQLIDIYAECKDAIEANNKFLLETDIDKCQPRLLFYDIKNKQDLLKYKEIDIALDDLIVRNKILQEKLCDLIYSIRFMFGSMLIERTTFKSVCRLLRQQKRQYYRLSLARAVNETILLHKQGQYSKSFKKIELIKKYYIDPLRTSIEKTDAFIMPSEMQDAYDAGFEKKYSPLIFDKNSILDDESKDAKKHLANLKYLYEKKFIKDTFINVYNLEGMVLRSMYQAQFRLYQNASNDVSTPDIKYFLKARIAFETAICIDTNSSEIANDNLSIANSVILSNLGFLLNKMADTGKLLPEEVLSLKEQALKMHEFADHNKKNDENDAAILNGLGFSIKELTKASDSKPNSTSSYEKALALFDRALKISPNSRDFLENKASTLIMMAEKSDKKDKKIQHLQEAEQCLVKVPCSSCELIDTLELLANVTHALGKDCQANGYLGLREKNKIAYFEQLNWFNTTNDDVEKLRQKLQTNRCNASKEYSEDSYQKFMESYNRNC